MTNMPPDVRELEGRAARAAERRSAKRYRTRLRSGKILTSKLVFLCDCRMHDISAGGACIVLARDIPLPAFVFLFDDLTRKTCASMVAWRKGTTLGLQFCVVNSLKE